MGKACSCVLLHKLAMFPAVTLAEGEVGARLRVGVGSCLWDYASDPYFTYAYEPTQKNTAFQPP